MKNQPLRIACFISPHGFGHAARTSAVMAALLAVNPNIRFDIFTRVPEWFFANTLTGSFAYHSLLTDVGLAQKNSLTEDLPETITRLTRLFPFNEPQLAAVATQVKQLGCRLILCDIAPLGIAVAKKAGIPSVLIENFTWDWIYGGYLAAEPKLEPFIAFLQPIFAAADYHIQTEPFCKPYPADLVVPPVSRPAKTPRTGIRQMLGIPEAAQVILLTMGGIRWEHTSFDHLRAMGDYRFIIPGSAEKLTMDDNLILLPHHSEFFHPDLLNAADAVVGKIGYSTLAEAYHAGIPYGYVTRRHFIEAQVLAEFVEAHMPGLPISPEAFAAARWTDVLPRLSVLPKHKQNRPNGAEVIAEFVAGLL